MRNLIAPVVLVTSLALGSAAFAATAPARSAAPAMASKTADCVKQWKGEKKHTQTRKAFLAACAAKA